MLARIPEESMAILFFFETVNLKFVQKINCRPICDKSTRAAYTAKSLYQLDLTDEMTVIVTRRNFLKGRQRQLDCRTILVVKSEPAELPVFARFSFRSQGTQIQNFNKGCRRF